MRRANKRWPRGDVDAQAVKVFCRIKPHCGNVPSCIEVIDHQTIKVSGNRSGIHKEVVKPDGLNGFDVQSESAAIMDRHRLDYQQRLRHPRNRRTPLGGALVVEVRCTDDALRVINNGLKRRRTGQTSLNVESSRSHCIFTIRLVRTGYDEKYDEVIQDKNLLVTSQLCLVDLAGSERANRAGTQGTRLKEASGINSSLMNLRKCIEVLREIQSAGSNGTSVTAVSRLVVPYRDKRLTHLFKSYFEGDGKVVMLICINPCVEDYDDLMHVLKFAESSQEVSTYRSVFATPASPAPPSTPQRPLPGTVARSAKRRISATPRTPLTAGFDMDNQYFTKLLANLTSYDLDISRILSALSKELTCSFDGCDSDMDDGSTTLEDAFRSETGAPELTAEDSAPEHDQRSKKGKKRRNSSFVDNLTALKHALAHRLKTSHRAADALDRDYTAFRQHLLETWITTVDRCSGEAGEQLNTLKSKIRRLEANLNEQSVTADHQQQDCMRQLEYYRTEADRLRAQLVTIQAVDEDISEASTDNAGSSQRTQGEVPVRHSAKRKRSNSRYLRPSCSQPDAYFTYPLIYQNLVAVLSRQWESRLAAQRETERRRSKRLLNHEAEHLSEPSQRKTPFNPRHRRSCSTGGRWLEHQEHNATPLGTIMSPSSGIKRRKSVKQVELKDTKKATDYLLHHQEADESGNLRTSLYKGKIIPTAGGGSAVVFNDVEELQQHSPCTPEPR